MAKDFNVIYPPSGKITLDGGLNTKYERSLIPDNESPDALNVVFSNGSVGTRGGSTKLNTTAIGSFVGDGLYTRAANDGTETMMAFAGGTTWALTGTSTFTTIGSAQSVWTAGVRVGAAQMENHIFMGNGGRTPYKWNGTDFTRHGVPAATGAVTTASQALGVLTGDMLYKITYVNSQSVEGDVGTATVTLAAVNATVRLTGIPVAPQSHGVSSRRIYRIDAGTYKRVATLANNTTTTYDDNIATSALGVAAPTDQGEPPKYQVIAQHQRRLFMNDPTNLNYVWYSELDEPYTVKTTSFQAFGDLSLDLVRTIAVYDNAIVVGGDQSHFFWYMPSTDPTDWIVIKIRSPYGSRSPFGSFLYNNKLMSPAVQSDKFVGFAAIRGSTVDPAATALEVADAGSDLTSDRIEPDMFDVVEGSVANISSMVYKNKAYIAVTDGISTTNNVIYIYDFSLSNLSKKQEGSWVPLSGLNAAQFTVYNGLLYYIASIASGFVYQLEATSYSDDGAAINSYFRTKEFAGLKGHENFEKDFRWANFMVELAGAYYMTVQYRTDSDVGEGQSKQIYLDPAGTTWGTLVWGAGNWDAGTGQRDAKIALGPSRGKRIQFKFSNGNVAARRFKIHWMTYTYNLKGKR